mmetsp:Transcript_8240/g.15292  ORF Transcript_8240/g.15292 Transcript_8240/m.15292 type:complete len:155 (+) Transcript_8240:62-526(+)
MEATEIKRRLFEIFDEEGVTSLSLGDVRERLEASLRRKGFDGDLKERGGEIDSCVEQYLLETFSLLPKVSDLLSDITKGKQDRSVHVKSLDFLVEKFKKCRKLVQTLPGIDLDQEEQVKLKEKLEITLKEKRRLVENLMTATERVGSGEEDAMR